MTDSSPAPERESSPGELPAAAVGRGVRRRVASPQWLARAAGVGLSVASIGFVAGFVVVFAEHGLAVFVSNPPSMRVVLALPYLIGVLAAGTAIGAVSAWRNRYWSRTARVHQTVLAVLGLAFIWQLVVLGFLP